MGGRYHQKYNTCEMNGHKYYLIHEKERVIVFKMIKRDFSSVLNDFKYAAL